MVPSGNMFHMILVEMLMLLTSKELRMWCSKECRYSHNRLNKKSEAVGDVHGSGYK